MRARKGWDDEPLEARALYSIRALARVANVTRHQLRRLLIACHVQLVGRGRALSIPLSEIEKKIPPLWASICAVERVRRQAEAGGETGRWQARHGASRARTPQG